MEPAGPGILMSSIRASAGAGSSMMRDHGAELLPQLGQRRIVAGHADRLDELAHDLRLRVHGARAPADPVAVEEPEGVLLAHRDVRQLQRRGRLLVAHARLLRVVSGQAYQQAASRGRPERSLVGEMIHAAVRRAIEAAVEEELAGALDAHAAASGETARRGYRDGAKERR